MGAELTQEQLLLLDNLMSTCFTQYDEAGNAAGHVVAFRGTGGIYDAWKDNFEGLYETDTEVQIVVGL